MGDPCIIVFASLQCHFLVTQSCSVVLLHLFKDLRCVGSRLCGAAVWTWTAGLQEDDLLHWKMWIRSLQKFTPLMEESCPRGQSKHQFYSILRSKAERLPVANF